MLTVDSSNPKLEPPLVASLPNKRTQEHWIVLSVALATLAILIGFALWIHPDARGFGTHEQLGLPACPMMHWTGIPCPGCGVTTSVALFAHGHFLESVRNQPLGFLIALAIPTFALWAIVMHLSGRDVSRATQLMQDKLFVTALFAIIALAWLYKVALVEGWIG